MTPRQRTADDGILSAQDLATAFQLDFKPEPGGTGGVRRAIIVILLLAISAGAIVLIINQDLRDQARVWASQKSMAIRGMITGRTGTKPVEPVASTPATPVTPARSLMRFSTSAG